MSVGGESHGVRRERRRLFPWILGAALGLAGVLSLFSGAAVILSGTESPPQAGPLSNADARISLAARMVTSRDTLDELARGQVLARSALRSRPADVRAYRVLGFAANAEGDSKRALTLVTLAANRSWRDELAHGWLMDREMRAGRERAAMRHADALLRGNLKQVPVLLPVISPLVAYPEGRAALVERMAANPSWRRYLVFQVSNSDRLAPFNVPLFRRLAATPQPPSTEEMESALAGLIRLARYRDAHAAWREIAPSGRSAKVAVFNGAFDTVDAPEPFQWQILDRGGTSVKLDTPPDREGQALAVQYDNYSAPSLVRQLLVLSPGRQRLSMDAYVGSRASETAASWYVICAESSERIATLRNPQKVSSWETVSVEFEIPTTGCSAQWLWLTQVPGDRRTEIRLWFDNVKVVPVARSENDDAAS